jgi:Domain of unknown function (DUF4157)
VDIFLAHSDSFIKNHVQCYLLFAHAANKKHATGSSPNHVNLHKEGKVLRDRVPNLIMPLTNINDFSLLINDPSKSKRKIAAIQPKLKISQPSDIHEQEANRIAEQVMERSVPSAIDSLANHENKTTKNCHTCEVKKENDKKLGISRKLLDTYTLETTDQISKEIDDVRSSSGFPLDSSTKEFMESRFGYDFSHVRIHSDARAAKSAQSLHALAFTSGNDIVFNRDQYQPNTSAGRELLAHELTHIIQQGDGNPTIRRKPDPKIPKTVLKSETKGHKEASWVRPSTTPSTGPVLVGVIYFRTKEFHLDKNDDELLRKLAIAYAPFARRNVGKPKGDLGLKGIILGYADPRRSVEPDNQKLSEERAFWVQHRLLRHLAAESLLIVGNFDLVASGKGVDTMEDNDSIAEGNLLAPMRRAEIYLEGQAAEPDTSSVAPKQEDQAPQLPKVHDYSAWDRFDVAIREGNKSEIEIMALRMLGVTGTQFSNAGENLFWTPQVAHLVRGAPSIRRIGYKKPPWWDSRSAGMGRSQGRNAARNELLYKASLLKRDYIETAKFYDVHFEPRKGSYVMLLLELRKDKPDETAIERYIVNLEYLNFMMDETHDLAQEVLKLAQK